MSNGMMLGCLWVAVAVLAILLIVMYCRKNMYKCAYYDVLSNIRKQGFKIVELEAKVMENGELRIENESEMLKHYQGKLKGITAELEKLRSDNQVLVNENRTLKEEYKSVMDMLIKERDEYEWFRTMVRSSYPEVYVALQDTKRVLVNLAQENLSRIENGELRTTYEIENGARVHKN